MVKKRKLFYDMNIVFENVKEKKIVVVFSIG
jgi:hypothetical protein